MKNLRRPLGVDDLVVFLIGGGSVYVVRDLGGSIAGGLVLGLLIILAVWLTGRIVERVLWERLRENR